MISEEILNSLSREDRFYATVYSINTLLRRQGNGEELDGYFLEWVKKRAETQEAK